MCIGLKTEVVSIGSFTLCVKQMWINYAITMHMCAMQKLMWNGVFTSFPVVLDLFVVKKPNCIMKLIRSTVWHLQYIMYLEWLHNSRSN